MTRSAASPDSSPKPLSVGANLQASAASALAAAGEQDDTYDGNDSMEMAVDDLDNQLEPPAAKGEADIGLMALWGLLNMSGYTAAQVNGFGDLNCMKR